MIGYLQRPELLLISPFDMCSGKPMMCPWKRDKSVVGSDYNIIGLHPRFRDFNEYPIRCESYLSHDILFHT